MRRLFFLLCSLSLALVCGAQNSVLISKQKMKLYVIGPAKDTLLAMPCGLGSEVGQKKTANDNRTAEGQFKVTSLKKLKRWAHGDNSKQGQLEGAYDTWLITLKGTDGKTAEVHGTYLQKYIGKRNTTGCVLIRAAEMEHLAKLINKKTLFTITADSIPQAVEVVDTLPKRTTEEERLDSILEVRGQQIVDTIHQLYSYEKLVLDIRLLQRRYPKLIRFEMRETTDQGRSIPVVYFGREEASQKVMIQAAMHAREYITTPLVMTMLETYARDYETASYAGRKLAEIFDSVAVVLVPMANPDGVEISQRGAASTTTEEAREWVQSKVDAGTSYTQIKANARGVDINRNFGNGFGSKREANGRKDFYYFEGPAPYSEVETRLLLSVAKEFPFAAFLNYHTRGNVVYWGCQNAERAINERAQHMAELIQSHTGYKLIGPEAQLPCGSWADEVETVFKRPSATIEVGTINPVPISEIHNIFRRNRWVWADLCSQILDGKF